ncbi:MAG: hypothetical protein AAGD05_12070, partial [Bacteroidota bacterium]
MKKNFLLLFVFALLISACDSDEDLDFLLSYDGANFSGPLLAAGTHEAAALFPASETDVYEGRQLIEVTWFNGPVAPASTQVKVYGPGINNSPG